MTSSDSSSPPNQKRLAALMVLGTGVFTLLSFVAMFMLAGNPPPANDARYAEPGQTIEAPFTSAILWFELVRNKAEVFQVLGKPGESDGDTMRTVMDTLNRVDYVFLVAYSLFNAALFLLVHVLNRRAGRNFFGASIFFTIGLVVALAMLLGDAAENAALLRLTGYADPAAIPDGDMLWLAIATHVKWGALWVACLLLGMGYASYFGPRPALLMALIFSGAGSIGFMSLLVGAALPLLEVAANLMSLGWVVALIHAGVVFRRAGASE